MKNLYKFIFLIALMLPFYANAQEKNINKGNDKFENYAFIDAQQVYLDLANEGVRDQNLLMRLADSYYYTANYKDAAKWYGVLYETYPNIDADYVYRYALSLKSNQLYDASNKVMDRFIEMKGEDYRSKLYVNERNYLQEIEAQSGRFELVNIGFNSELSDFAPTFYQGDLVIASNRAKRASSKRLHDWNEQPFLDLYLMSGNDLEKSNKLDKNINTKYHESTAIFTKDGNTIYFTRNNYYKNDFKTDDAGLNRLKLLRGKRNGESWDIEELPFNSDQYSVAHPALSNDEKTLYFASDMPGGKGMSDLYKVSIEGDGFGTPVNLGDKINTENRETFPFVSSDKLLYFASDGHPGLGGLDVFVAEINDKDFGDVYNIGKPVNSPVDDFTFIINDITGVGYFASNREGGMGDDDIYSFKATQKLITSCKQKMEGFVLDKNTKQPIPGADVVLLNDAGTIIATTVAGEDGSFSFPVECTSQYAVRGLKDGYETAEKPFVTSNKNGDVVKKDLYLNPGADLGLVDAPIGSDLFELLGLNPIYFDLDKDFIRADAQIELRKVIAVMKRYPTLKVDVRSHTDSRANDQYNMDLSNRRANSTINWIVSNGGIDAGRLTGKGYGETQLVNECANGVNCSEGKHQLNRRSEFIIVAK